MRKFAFFFFGKEEFDSASFLHSRGDATLCDKASIVQYPFRCIQVELETVWDTLNWAMIGESYKLHDRESSNFVGGGSFWLCFLVLVSMCGIQRWCQNLLWNLSRLYYQYIPEGKEYPVLCRRLELGKNGWIKSFLGYARGGFGKAEVLLDWNEIAKKYGKLLSFFLMW